LQVNDGKEKDILGGEVLQRCYSTKAEAKAEVDGRSVEKALIWNADFADGF